MEQVGIVLTAIDQTKAAFDSAKRGLEGVGSAAANLDTVASRLPLIGGAVAAAFGGATVSSFIKSSIDAADSLNDLSQQTGVGIEMLVSYRLAAEQSGTSLESVAKGVKKLSTNLLENGTALAKAGISAKDTNGAMRQIADLFQVMPDGIEKSAIASKLFGERIGTELIPMLNGGSAALDKSAASTERYASMMAMLAPQADQLNDTMAELHIVSQAVGANMALAVVPGLTEVATTMAMASQEGGIFKGVLVGIGGAMSLLKDGWDTFSFTKDLNEQLRDSRTRIDELRVARERLAASGDTKNAPRIDELVAKEERMLTVYKARQQAMVQAHVSTLGAISDARDLTLANAIAAEAAKKKADEMKAHAAEWQRLLKMAGKESVDDSAAKKALADYESLTKSLREKIAVEEAAAQSTEKLSEGQKMAAKFVADLAAKTLKLTEAQKIEATTKLEQLIALEKVNKAQEEFEKTLADQLKEQEKSVTALQAEAEKVEQSARMYGLSKSAIEDVTIARLEEQRAMASGWDSQEGLVASLEKEIAARKRLRNAYSLEESLAGSKKLFEEQQRTVGKFMDDIERSATDAIYRGLEAGGRDGAKVARDTIINTLKAIPIKLTVEATIDPVMGVARSALGLPNAAGAAGNAGNMYTTVGSYFQSSTGWAQQAGLALQNASFNFTGTTADTMFNAGSKLYDSAGTIGKAADVFSYATAAYAASQGKYGTAVGQAIGTYFGGPIGAYIGGKIGSLLDGKQGGPKTEGGYATTTAATIPAYANSGELVPVVQAITQGVEATYRNVLQLFDQRAGTLGGGAFISRDFAGTAQTQLDQSFVINGREVYDRAALFGGAENVGRSDQELTDAINQSSALAVLNALSATEGLPAIVDRYLDSIANTKLTAEEAATAINKVRLFDTVIDGMKRLGFAGDSVTESMVQSMGGLEGAAGLLSGAYDSLLTDAEKSALATRQVSEAFAAIGADVPASLADYRAMLTSAGSASSLAAEGGAAYFASLLALAPAYKQVIDANVTTTEVLQTSARTVADIANERRTLQDQLDELTMTSTELLGKQRDALDESNRSLFDQVNAAKLAKDAAESLTESLKQAGAQKLGLIDHYSVKDTAWVQAQFAGAGVDVNWADVLGLSSTSLRDLALTTVSGIDATDPANTALLTKLDGLTGAWDTLIDIVAQREAGAAPTPTVAPPVDPFAQARQSWQDKLDLLAGSITERDIALRDAPDAATQALMKLVWASEDASAAITKAATAAKLTESGTQAYTRAMLELTGDSAGLAKFDRSAEAARLALEGWTDQQIAQMQASRDLKASTDALTQSLNDAAATAKSGAEAAFGGVQRAVAAQVKSLEADKAAALKQQDTLIAGYRTSADAARSLFDELHTLTGALNPESFRDPLTASAGLSTLKDYLATAKTTGALPTLDQINPALEAIRTLSPENFATAIDYARAKAEGAYTVAALNGIAKGQETAAKTSLDALNALIKSADDQKTVATEYYDGMIDGVQAQLDAAQAQMDALNGIDTSVLSVKDAVDKLAVAIGGAMTAAATAKTGTTVLTAMGQGHGGAYGTSSDGTLSFASQAGSNFISRQSDAEYAALKAAALAGTYPAGTPWGDDIRNDARWASFETGINRVPYAMTARLHPDEAVVPATFNPFNPNARMNGIGGDTQRLESLVEALTAEVQRLQAVVAAGNANTEQLADQFDSLSEGGNALRANVVESVVVATEPA